MKIERVAIAPDNSTVLYVTQRYDKHLLQDKTVAVPLKAIAFGCKLAELCLYAGHIKLKAAMPASRGYILFTRFVHVS